MKNKNKESDTFPTKKDLFYWLLITLIFIIVVSVWKTDDPGDLADQIALGGTFFSILLAVIAIIFSFVQSSNASIKTHRISEQISYLTQSIAELTRVKKNLEETVSEQRSVAEIVNNYLQGAKDGIENKALREMTEDVIARYQGNVKDLGRFEIDHLLWVENITKSNQYIVPIILELFKINSKLGLKEIQASLAQRNVNIGQGELVIVLHDMLSKGLISNKSIDFL